MPPAAAQAPELIWFVADTPLPPSISGSTSRPAYRIGLIPLNIVPPDRVTPPIVALRSGRKISWIKVKRVNPPDRFTVKARISVDHYFLVIFRQGASAIGGADRAAQLRLIGE